MTEAHSSSSDPEHPESSLRRRLRAAFSADVANFSGSVSVNETGAFGLLETVLRTAREELDRHDGVVISMPGDGLFGLFESAVSAVQCAIAIQERLAAGAAQGGMRLRIGIHLGDVLFKGDVAFGETLNIAARLQALADPGGTLVSAAVVDAVSARISAAFEARGVPKLKNIPRRIATYAVHPHRETKAEANAPEFEPLDHTMRLPTQDAASTTEPQVNNSVSQSGIAKAQPVEDAAAPARETLVQRLARLDPQAISPADQSNKTPVPPPTSDADKPSVHKHPQLTVLDVPPTDEAIEVFADAVAVHLGPVARVMVRRKSKHCASLADLLLALEGEIPTSLERHAFRARILQKFAR